MIGRESIWHTLPLAQLTTAEQLPNVTNDADMKKQRLTDVLDLRVLSESWIKCDARRLQPTRQFEQLIIPYQIQTIIVRVVALWKKERKYFIHNSYQRLHFHPISRPIHCKLSRLKYQIRLTELLIALFTDNV